MITPLLAGRDPVELLEHADFIWVVAALVATLFVGAFVFTWIERWRKRQLSDTPADDLRQLTTFRQMFENGELSKEEYDRIKSKEAQRLKNKLDIKAPGPSHKAPPAQPSPQEPEPPPT
ncbi:MAG: hypothetical protein K8T89_09085 [Planctomycetes bacterium]|nr:hypothetical protein [Planctomycetota bacterium]